MTSTRRNNKLNIAVLHAKLIFTARSSSPLSIFKQLTSAKPKGKSRPTLQELAQRPWIQHAEQQKEHAEPKGEVAPQNQHAEQRRERHFILNCDTWTFREYGTAWEAVLVASYYNELKPNPPIDAGNGVYVYVKDYNKYRLFMKGFEKNMRATEALCYEWDQLRPRITPGDIRREEARRLKEKMRRLGVDGTRGTGSVLWCYVAAALKKVSMGEV